MITAVETSLGDDQAVVVDAEAPKAELSESQLQTQLPQPLTCPVPKKKAPPDVKPKVLLAGDARGVGGGQYQ
jgi:hypothetical protein